MKSRTSVYIILIFSILFFGWRSNPPDGRTGAPGESSCGVGSCHSTNGTDIDGSVSLLGLPEVVEADMTYNLTVRLQVTAGNPGLGGFQMTALDSDNNGIGNFSNPGSNVGISSLNTEQYVDHRDAKSFTGTTINYSVNWTAPATFSSEVMTFYLASIFANENGARSGDKFRMAAITKQTGGSTDADNDGFDNSVDCDDTDATINPDATEIPNNDVDENCDGVLEVIDMDEDGFHSDEDCNDEDASINPDAEEIANNMVDENCDGTVFIEDLDNDGFNALEDCDDTDGTINPDALEKPNNDVDEDCDGEALIIDNDSDGFNSDDDCNDMNPLINPDAMEIPADSIDNNCDGVIDECICTAEFNPVCGSDGNTYSNACEAECAGINNFTEGACVTDEDMDGFTNDVDCNDNDININPDADEINDNDIDENCDGVLGMSTPNNIAGSIKLSSGAGLNNVTVRLSNGMEVNTNNNGDFSFANTISDSSTTITFSRNDNHANGLSAVDLVVTINHILGKTLFTDNVQLLAADADGNGTVSALDLVHTVNVILGNWTEFMNRESWGFSPSSINLSDIENSNSINVQAYKVGDANGSALGN